MDNKILAERTGLCDELTGALIGLARACENNPYDDSVIDVLIEGLTTITDAKIGNERIKEVIEKVREKKYEIVPNCKICTAKCGNTDDYDVAGIWNDDKDIRSLKLLLLSGIRAMAADICHAGLGYRDEEINNFFIKVLCVLSYDMQKEDLLTIAMEAGETVFKCRELLNKADAEK